MSKVTDDINTVCQQIVGKAWEHLWDDSDPGTWTASDCFCGRGGNWASMRTEWPTDDTYYCNDQKAIEFVRVAVAEKIARESK